MQTMAAELKPTNNYQRACPALQGIPWTAQPQTTQFKVRRYRLGARTQTPPQRLDVARIARKRVNCVIL